MHQRVTAREGLSSFSHNIAATYYLLCIITRKHDKVMDLLRLSDRFSKQHQLIVSMAFPLQHATSQTRGITKKPKMTLC